MLVFGDRIRHEGSSTKIGSVRQHLAAAEREAGIVRHGLLVAALIGAGELAQGIADRESEARGGRDGRRPAGQATMDVTVALARLVARSWSSGFPDGPHGSTEVAAALAALEALPLPEPVLVRQPEGFAFYGVYPETYLAAARALASAGPVEVIGIRSIGTTLAALVAAAIGAPTPLTVRPVGHPFRREFATDGALDREIRSKRDAAFVIVDEGPGLSGSSFAAVSRQLQESGVELRRIVFFPSHAGLPGARADSDVQALWARHPRHVESFESVVLHAPRPAHRLASWVADLVGPPLAPLTDISGGGWRTERCGDEARWPPVQAWQERRKYLATTGSGAWLLKFAGLGEVGLARLGRARTLAEAGFTPRPAGWRHGFLVERWHAEAASLNAAEIESAGFLDRLGDYLGFRARTFAVPPGRGASLEGLREMALHNVEEALGPAASRQLSPLLSRLAGAGRHARPIETDNRLHRWEWLLCGGAVLKTDALDHHAGHDLVGCQDVAWDIAGAAVEFALDRGRLDQLMGRVEQGSGVSVAPDLVRLMTPIYLAFQLGIWTEALASAAAPEAPRLTALLDGYRGALIGLLRGD